MNKDFWIMLKKFVEPIEETNDKIKTEKEMIISVCEEQLKENIKLVCDCSHTQACKICAESKDINWEIIEPKN